MAPSTVRDDYCNVVIEARAGNRGVVVAQPNGVVSRRARSERRELCARFELPGWVSDRSLISTGEVSQLYPFPPFKFKSDPESAESHAAAP
jgi:hypothetical protein